MTRRLNSIVHAHREDGSSQAFGPGDDVPAWAAKQITNPAVWDGAAPKTEDAPPPPPPPSGEGTGGGDPGAGDGGGDSGSGDQGPGDQPPVQLPAGLDAESTLKELREYAKANSINLRGATSKEDVLAAIANPE